MNYFKFKLTLSILVLKYCYIFRIICIFKINRTYMHKYIWLFLFLFSVQKSYSVEQFLFDIKFEEISIDKGLPQSVVNCIYKDSEGLLWIGTQDGLCKYDAYSFTLFKYEKTKKYSISNNNISAIVEDMNGGLWIGTTGGGLNYYDKIRDTFQKVEFHKTGETSIIQTDYILSLYVDRSNNLWLGTDNYGIIYYDIENSKVINYYTQENSNITSNSISSFNQDYKSLWIGTENGLNRFDYQTGAFTTFLYDSSGNIENYIEILSIAIDGNNLWLGTWGNGVIKFNVASQNVKNYLPEESMNTILSYYVNDVHIDRNGKIWMATWDGLSMLDTLRDEFINWVNNPLIPYTLSHNNINCLFEDENQIIWLGTWGGGINKFINKTPEIQHVRKIPGKKNSIINNSVWGLSTDKKGNVWIGTDEGVTKYNRTENLFTSYQSNYYDSRTLGDNTVYCIFQDSRDIIWLGTWTGGLNKYNPADESFTRYIPSPEKNSISSDIVNCILEDTDGYLWICTSNGLNKFDVVNNLFFNSQSDDSIFKLLANRTVLYAHLTKKNDLWIGTDGDGLFCYNLDNKNIRYYTYQEENENSISSNVIFSILEDRKENIWCGSEAGLNIINLKNGKIKLIANTDGLPNDVIYGILSHENEIWISTNNGLSRITYDFENDSVLEIRNFDESDNLQSTEFNLGAFHKSKNGEMFFGGINGYNSFFPDRIKTDSTPLKLIFTDFQLFNESAPLKSHLVNKNIYTIDTNIHYLKEISLDYDQNIISFEFAALYYKNPQKIKYKYRLKGFEEKWNLTDASRRFVTYTNLRPGDYLFQVKGINHQGIENDAVLTLSLKINPPFWLTIWFYILVLVVIVGLLYLYINYREKLLKLEKLRLEKQVRLRTQKILAQKQEMTDSIEYAKRIQNALLPDTEILKKLTSDYFLLYSPKSIVSGDFYWFSNINNVGIYVIADCTGHGVPGAFMSMLGISYLNKIVNENKITDPADILNKLRHNIISSLHQTDAADLNDGIELAIVCLNRNNNNLYFAGAMNPGYLIQNNELIELVPDTMPISLHFKLNQPFKTKVFNFQPDATIYLFTDGLIDQFGGRDNKRFKSKRLKKILLDNHNLPFGKQESIILHEYNQWKGEQEQIDDVLILGFRP